MQNAIFQSAPEDCIVHEELSLLLTKKIEGVHRINLQFKNITKATDIHMEIVTKSGVNIEVFSII